MDSRLPRDFRRTLKSVNPHGPVDSPKERPSPVRFLVRQLGFYGSDFLCGQAIQVIDHAVYFIFQRSGIDRRVGCFASQYSVDRPYETLLVRRSYLRYR